MHMRRTGTQTLILLLVSATTLAASEGIINGHVRDIQTQEDLPGANIMVDGTRWGAAADASGNFRIENIPPGEYRLSVRMVGYEDKILQQVRVVADLNTVLSIEMESFPIELGVVTVTRDKGNDRDEKLSPSHRDLQPRQILALAGGAEDLFWGMTTMPGVIARPDVSAQFYVRGGTPDQNLIIIDDVTVFNPYRLKALGGPISMFNPDVVESMELLPGGFPAQYGDKLSSVLTVRNREGDRYGSHAQLGSSLIDMRVLAEGPLPGAGGEGSWLLSGRRTYYDIILDNLADVPVGTVFPNFRDIQAKVVYDLSPEQKLRVNITDSQRK